MMDLGTGQLLYSHCSSLPFGWSSGNSISVRPTSFGKQFDCVIMRFEIFPRRMIDERTCEQSVPSMEKVLFSGNVWLFTWRWQRTGRPIKRSSPASSSLEIKNLTLPRARLTDAKCNAIFSGVHYRENVNDCRFLMELSTGLGSTGQITLIFAIPHSAALCASLGETILSLLPPPLRPVSEKDVITFDTVIVHHGAELSGGGGSRKRLTVPIWLDPAPPLPYLACVGLTFT